MAAGIQDFESDLGDSKTVMNVIFQKPEMKSKKLLAAPRVFRRMEAV